MPDEIVATPTEVQTPAEIAPDPVATTPAPSYEDAQVALAEARIAGASPKEIVRLEALAATPVEPEPAPTTQTEAVEAEPVAEPDPEPTPTGATPTEPVEPKEPDRFRFKDAEDRAVAQIAKAKGISLAAAVKLYAGEPAATETAPVIPEPPQPPPAIAAIDTEIASHEATLAKIKEDRKAYAAEPSVFGEELAALDEKRNDTLEALARAGIKRVSVEAAESQRETVRLTQEQKRDAEFTEARKVYNDLNDPESPLYMLTAQLSQKWRSAGDVRADDIHACAGEAAKRLNLKPATPKAEPTPTPVAPKPPGPAPGTRSSAPPPAVKSVAEVTADAEGRAMAAALGEKYVPGRNYQVAVEVR